jgi:LuxR family maltose regulon positive regulatory protein
MPSHFWETFSQTFASLNPDLASSLLSLGFPETEEMRYFLRELLRDEIKQRFNYVFVFDDLHLLKEEGAVFNFIGQVAFFSSVGTNVIMISRRDAIPNAAEILEKGLLSRIDESALLFTRDEVAEYLKLADITFSDGILTDILYDTEGLPFMVALAIRLLARNPDDFAFVRSTFKGSFEQIIDRQLFAVISEELQNFLLKLSLVKHLAPELIAEMENGQHFLRELLRATSLIRYDYYMHVYRLHHLLLAYLEDRQDLLTEKDRLETYEKAARWCAANGYRLDAFRYYHSAGDYHSIIVLAYTYPLALPLDVAEELLGIFEEASEEVLDSDPSGRVLHTRLILLVGRLDEAVEQVQKNIALLEKRPLNAANGRTLMGLHNNLGFMKMLRFSHTGDCSFYRHFENALSYFEASGDPPVGGYQMYNVGPYAFQAGRSGADDPKAYIEAVRRSAACTTITMRGCMHGLDILASAEYAFFCGRNGEAENHALRCITAAHEYGQFEIESRALFILIRVYLQMGRYEMILNALARLEALTEVKSFTYRYLVYEVISGWFYATIGEIDRVESWLKSDHWSPDQNSFISGIDDFAKARYYLAQKNYQTLFSFVNSRATQYGVAHFIVGRVGALAMKSVCYLHFGNREEAFAQLREAYDLSRPLELNMPFIELGSEMRRLAAAALKASVSGIPTEWLERIRSQATTYTKRVTFIRSRYQATHGIETSVQLTDRELEILRDLTHGLSRMEISLARGISINTLKSMLRMICDKLGVESLMDAIRFVTAKRLL